MIRVQVARKAGSHGTQECHEDLEHRLNAGVHILSHVILTTWVLGCNLLSAGAATVSTWRPAVACINFREDRPEQEHLCRVVNP